MKFTSSTHASSTPLLSILLPCRNAQATLEACLGSIGNQTLGDYELIAVDDGSCDDTGRILMAWADHDPRIQLVRPGRIGLVGALNLGLDKARCELVARMDADDLMHPRRLERQYRYYDSHPEPAAIACQVRAFPGHAVRHGYRAYVDWQNQCITPDQIATELYVESPLAHPSVMLRRSAVVDAGGYREGDFPEDYELWLRLHARGRLMAKLPEVLLWWRDSDTRHSRLHAAYSREAFDRLRAQYLDNDPRLPRDRPLAYWGAGRKTRRRADRLIALGHRPAAWIDVDSRKIGKRIDGIPVHPPHWLERTNKPFVLGYVANHGARQQIQAFLNERGYRAGRDYLMVG